MNRALKGRGRFVEILPLLLNHAEQPVAGREVRIELDGVIALLERGFEASTLKPFTILNPSTFQNDFALTRTFPLTGAQNIQFRWEVFNVFNHVNFNAPVTALNSGSFGQIQTAGDPRIMQFAVKFTY
jgi:hypothetical protein